MLKRARNYDADLIISDVVMAVLKKFIAVAV